MDANFRGANLFHNFLQGTEVHGAVNGTNVFSVTAPKVTGNGFVAIGTDSYGIADFDNFKITSAADGLRIMRRNEERSRSWKEDTLYFETERH